MVMIVPAPTYCMYLVATWLNPSCIMIEFRGLHICWQVSQPCHSHVSQPHTTARALASATDGFFRVITQAVIPGQLLPRSQGLDASEDRSPLTVSSDHLHLTVGPTPPAPSSMRSLSRQQPRAQACVRHVNATSDDCQTDARHGKQFKLHSTYCSLFGWRAAEHWSSVFCATCTANEVSRMLCRICIVIRVCMHVCKLCG